MNKVILDTDPGVDDALALLLATQSPELEILGICTVSGNVPLDTGTRNAFRILDLAGRTDISIYEGADQPLKRNSIHAMEIHGQGGLGATELTDPGGDPAGKAVDFIVDTLSKYPEEVTLIAVGPLTNLAMAESQFPGLLRKAKKVVVMGGAIGVAGNSSPTAEFNFFADPDAAQEVIRSGASILLVPLDVTRKVGLNIAVCETLHSRFANPRTEFVLEAIRPMAIRGEKAGGLSGVFLHDPVAVGVALSEGPFKIESFRLDVETRGVLTLGQVVADRRNVVEGLQLQGYSVDCVMDVDADQFLDFFLERVFGKV